MNNVDVVRDPSPIGDIFSRFQENLKIDLIDVLNTVRVCKCGHKSRIESVQEKVMWYKRMTRLYQVILAILTLTVLLTTYGFWLSRYYNQSLMFGNSCSSSWLWPFEHCPVAF